MNIGQHFATHSSPSQPDNESGSQGKLVREGRPLTVLIVEDDLSVGEYLADVIGEFGGHVVGIAAEPSEAFGLVVEHRPDIVIMDIRLKNGHDGLHAADAMRLLYRTPIVFCTGYGDSETLRRIKQFGGSEYLVKPVQPEQLRDAILRAAGL
jgi:CheY-like chemotaxis protein